MPKRSKAFANQVAVITGASSGIGWALSRTLAEEGCRVGLLARRQDRLDELAAAIARDGGQAIAVPADVSSWPATQAAVEKVRGQLGPVDLLVANAGVGRHTPLGRVNALVVEEMFRVNVLGTVHAVEAVLPDMLERGQGHLAAISSLASYKGLPNTSGYCASKAAINVYLEGLRIQLRSRGIAVTTICPGFVRTPMIEGSGNPHPFLLEPEEAARRIVRALRRRPGVFNFPWQMAWFMKLAAWLPDWLVARIVAEK